MKRIVICYDGTWNSLINPDEVTNVVRVGQAVRKTDDDGIAQMVYYNAGVGSGGPLDRFLGGVFGVGLRSNVKRGLAFLTLNWEPGDEIYIFGFSRGAYSARALAGVIGAIRGIPKPQYFDREEEIWNFYRLPYREREAARERVIGKDNSKFSDMFRANNAKSEGGEPAPLITCLAVWDTVGSYGIPAGLGLGALARMFTSWTRGFHDNVLGSAVGVALHAMAIDERRRAFPPTAWVIPKEHAGSRDRVRQVWFAGTHSNIGGGYMQSGLSDMALLWMISEVTDLTGLRFDENYIGQHFWPCAACSLYRSNRGWLVSSLRPFQRSLFPKPVATKTRYQGKAGTYDMVPLGEKVHWSVIERIGRNAIIDESISKVYGPSNLPAEWRAPLWSEAKRAAAEQDPRVALETVTEGRFRELCRLNNNKRQQNCALFCDLAPVATDTWLNRARSYISAPARRSRRLDSLRSIWGMPPRQK
jgi:hypothetical protein